MKIRKLKNQLHRAAAVIEDPNSEIRSHRGDLVTQLVQGANALDQKKLSTDAAYALSEEAFRAGFKAGWELKGQGWQVEPLLEDHAWAYYEPSEDVKALIDG